MSLMLLSLTAPFTAPLGLAAALAMPPQDAAAAPRRDLLTIRVEALEALCAHPKDQGLARAFQLLQARLAELPTEIPDAPPIDPAWIALAGDLVGAPKSLRVGIREGVPLDGREVPFYGTLTVHRADAASASALEGQVLDVLRAMGAPDLERRSDGLFEIPGPPIPVGLGASGSDVVLNLDAPAAPPLELGDPLLPAGVRPTMAVALHYGPLVEMVLDQMAREEPQAAEFMSKIFERFGLTDFTLNAATATDAERSYGIVRLPGYAATMRRLGVAPEGSLTPADLALVPRDATWASVGKANFKGVVELVLELATEALAAQGVEGDPVEMLAGATGFDLRADFVDLLGDTYGMYASDTTGGGGMMSTVCFVALRDAEHALETRERLEELLNGVFAMQAQGYVQVRGWAQDDVEYATLMFPGLPVPLEPTVAMTDAWLFVGATGGATLEAVRQSKATGAPNLLDQPALRAQLAGGMAGIQALSFQDTERLVRDGYGTMRMMASALANGVRSRVDGLRDAGQVLPPYHELVQDVKAAVSVGRMAGDDYIMESRGDASMAVSLTALCGWLQSNGVFLALPMLAVAGQQQQAAMGMGPGF